MGTQSGRRESVPGPGVLLDASKPRSARAEFPPHCRPRRVDLPRSLPSRNLSGGLRGLRLSPVAYPQFRIRKAKPGAWERASGNREFLMDRRKACLAMAAILLAGCGSVKIARINADPSRYRNHTVRVTGVVVNSMGAFGTGGYEIEDDTGRI